MVDFISYPEISYLYDEFTTVRTLFLSFLPPSLRFNRVEERGNAPYPILQTARLLFILLQI